MRIEHKMLCFAYLRLSKDEAQKGEFSSISSRVVYVSCDPATLARDIKIFLKNGYALKEYTPCDLFPRTSHVETVVLLCRG